MCGALCCHLVGSRYVSASSFVSGGLVSVSGVVLTSYIVFD